MNGVSKGVLVRPLPQDVLEMELYDLQVQLTDWVPPQPEYERIRGLGEALGLNLDYRKPRTCPGHVHAPCITGFLCMGSNLETQAEDFMNAVSSALNLEMKFRFIDQRNWIPDRQCGAECSTT